jgi:Polysulphide reductase, NrfD
MSRDDFRSYHGQPVIKEPTWTWEVPTYFFTGGMGGASAGLAYLAGLRGNDVLARRAWAASLGAIGVSPVFLISDLGRPARFLNMLRMFKVTSRALEHVQGRLPVRRRPEVRGRTAARGYRARRADGRVAPPGKDHRGPFRQGIAGHRRGRAVRAVTRPLTRSAPVVRSRGAG